MKVDTDQIGLIIGPGGKTIQGMQSFLVLKLILMTTEHKYCFANTGKTQQM
jgi:hypothetical protein